MRLLRVTQPFDHPDFVNELKYDGFGAIGQIEGNRRRLISRNCHRVGRWDSLKAEIARTVPCRSAILDGEVVCLDPDGRLNIYALMLNRRAPFVCAFDALEIDGGTCVACRCLSASAGCST